MFGYKQYQLGDRKGIVNYNNKWNTKQQHVYSEQWEIINMRMLWLIWTRTYIAHIQTSTANTNWNKQEERGIKSKQTTLDWVGNEFLSVILCVWGKGGILTTSPRGEWFILISKEDFFADFSYFSISLPFYSIFEAFRVFTGSRFEQLFDSTILKENLT